MAYYKRSVYINNNVDMVALCRSIGLHAEYKVFLPPGQGGRDLSFSWYMIYYTSCLVPYPRAERGGGKGGSDIKDPPRCQMGP